MAKRIAAIIVAGGSGRRMQSHLPKQFMMLGNMPVLARTINTMARALPGADIVVVLPEEHIGMWCNLAARFDVAPGPVRLQSGPGPDFRMLLQHVLS